MFFDLNMKYSISTFFGHKDPEHLQKRGIVNTIIKKLGNNFLFNFLGTVFNQGSTFIFSIVVANIIGKKAFGEYAMTIGTLSVVALLTQLACGITNTKYVAEFRTSNKPKAGRILALTLTLTILTGFFSSTMFLLASKYIAVNLVNNPNISRTLRLGSFYVLFASLIMYLLGALAGLGSYKRVARAGIISGTVYLCLGIPMSCIYGLNGAVFGVFLSAAIQTVVLLVEFLVECNKQGIKLSFLEMKAEIGIIPSFMLPAAVSSYVAAPAAWSANAFLARQSGGYEELALYSAANSIRLLVLFVPNIVNTVSMSVLNNSKNEGHEYKYTYLINILIMVLVSIVVALPVTVFGKTVLGFFGNKFITGYPILVVLMASTVPESLGIGLFQHIHAQNRMWLSLITITIPQSLMIVYMSYTLVPAYGARGLALSYTVSWVAAALITMMIVKIIGHEPCSEETINQQCQKTAL